jgi:L-ascorbate metabolism protein UlaG (beta-lactamase superfamily)
VFSALPTEVHRQLANAKPPFDGLTVVLVSHDHPDHVQWRGLEKFLGNNAEAQLITAAPILRGLKEGAQDYEAIAKQVTPVPITRGTGKKLMQEEMSVDFFTLEHRGKERVFNLAHLIDMGGLRILHIGDADPTRGNFAAYDLAAKEIDVAFVPYWFFGSPEGVQLLFEGIRARILVACHVPPQELATFGPLLKEQFPDVVLFTEALEKRSFQPAGAPAAAPAPAAGDGGEDG